LTGYCSPQTPEVIQPKFYLFLNGNTNEEPTVLNWRHNDASHLLKNGRKTVFIVHGWNEKVSTNAYILEMKKAFINIKGYNAIVLDWRHGNGLYKQAVANVRTVGAMLGRAILNWGISDRSLVVGFSLGAHIAGEAGRFVQKHGFDHHSGQNKRSQSVMDWILQKTCSTDVLMTSLSRKTTANSFKSCTQTLATTSLKDRSLP